jgi:hypothetical protein
MPTKEATPPKETTPARVPRKGKMSGSITEWCVFWTLKPGVSGQKIIDDILAGLSRRPGGIRQSYKDIGVHDARYVLFDNDTRLLITISFDNDFDKYFDDAMAFLTGGDPTRSASSGSRMLRIPEGGYRSRPGRVKNFLPGRRYRTSSRIPPTRQYGGDAASAEAFQQVLDHPRPRRRKHQR